MNLSRQAMIVKNDPSRYSMLIIGAGGVGSNAAYVAACMGIERITVYDPEDVEEANIAPQFYACAHIGVPKVRALFYSIDTMTNVKINGIQDRYTDQPGEYDIVLIGVDSMQIRRGIWRANRLKWKYWLDARMGGTTCSVISLNQNNVDRYQKFLDWESTFLPCGMKATAFITKGTLQGLIGEMLAAIINEQPMPLWSMRDAVAFISTEVWE